MDAKRLAGERAAEFVEDGMTIGLGTGTTVYWTLRRLGEMVASGSRVRGVATSKQTEDAAREFGIPLATLADARALDLTIDGADEFDPEFNLIKGGGGALLREKFVALASRRLIVVADESKRVAALGAFGLPVEVVPFAFETTLARIAGTGCAPRLRATSEGAPYVTDNGNYIADCACGAINDPAELHRRLKLLPGVIETGLFVGMVDAVIVAGESGVEVLERSRRG